MKKFLVTILAFIYLGVSSGIAMDIHYCMGKISSIDLIHSKNKCGKCGMKLGDGGCCKSEFKMVKLSDTHQLISNEINISFPVVVLNDHYSNFSSDLIFTEVASSVNKNSPPESPGISLNILHCVFRI